MPVEVKKRRSGKTTRTIDRCIQELFENGVTYVYEGRGTASNYEMVKDVFSKFRRRMDVEHPHVKIHFAFGTFDGVTCYKVKIVE